MCLAVPMKIVSVEPDQSGEVDFDGVRRRVNLSLVSQPQIGEYVIVHAGFAIEKLDPAEADQQVAIFAELKRSL